MQHQAPLKHIFWSNCHLSDFFWNLWGQTNRCSSKKVNIWTLSGYFPFFISFFSWKWNKQEIFKRRTRERSEAVTSSSKFIKKETLPQVFSCEFCKISNNTFSNRTPPVAATERWKIVKRITMQRNFFTQVIWKLG